MLRKNPTGHYPEVSEKAFIDETAIICGKIIIEDNVFVGPYAVIRADELDENGELEPIVIRRNSNIQDGVIIHSKSGQKVVIGEGTSIAHRCIVHGPCTIGDNVFIGFNSVIFDCEVGDNCVIRHNAVVDGCDLPAGYHVPSITNIGPGFDLQTIMKVGAEHARFSESVVEANHYLLNGYKKITKSE